MAYLDLKRLTDGVMFKGRFKNDTVYIRKNGNVLNYGFNAERVNMALPNNVVLDILTSDTFEEVVKTTTYKLTDFMLNVLNVPNCKVAIVFDTEDEYKTFLQAVETSTSFNWYSGSPTKGASYQFYSFGTQDMLLFDTDTNGITWSSRDDENERRETWLKLYYNDITDKAIEVVEEYITK